MLEIKWLPVRVVPSTPRAIAPLQDSLGFYKVEQRIAERELALELEMHYPTQLLIEQELVELRMRAEALSPTNATWTRTWSLRLCTSAAEAGTLYLSVYGSHAMTPFAHMGEFRLRLTHERFEGGSDPSTVLLLKSGNASTGCLRRGGSRTYLLSTPPSQPELTSLGIVRADPHFLADEANHVSQILVRRGSPPTNSTHDVRLLHPQLRGALSSCDVQEPQLWYLHVSLAESAAVSEVFFRITAVLENSQLQSDLPEN